MSWDVPGRAGDSGGNGTPADGGGGAAGPGGTGGYGGWYGAPPPPPNPPTVGGFGAAPGGYGTPGGYGVPGAFGPPPGTPGAFMQPPPPSPPKPPADPVRAAAVALLNLSGLGLGYALMRRWIGFVLCLAVTGVLIAVALPAKPDGVSHGLLITYLLALVLAAVHGGWRGLRTRLTWLPLAPVAVVVGLVLLAVPAGGVVLYGNARDDATQKMLLDRLATADKKVAATKGEDFKSAQPQFKSALSVYRDLKDHHSGSKAAKLLPDRMKTYYSTVAAPYDQKQYCDAIEPLKYLRTVPDSYGKDGLGSLAAWPDDRLATSLYDCGVVDLENTDTSTASGGDEQDLGELLATFPDSPQAAKVEPAVNTTIDKAVKAIGGSDPCGATDRLRGLSSFATTLSGKAGGSSAHALDTDANQADGHVESGTYSCGVHQYKSGDFDTALTTMNDFTGKYPHDKNRALAKKFAIAAEIATQNAAAGKHVPTLASGGSLKLTVSNDSPDEVEILYTGKVTGSFTMKACGSCHDYSSEATALVSACKDTGKHYPQKTVYLPAGTVYLLHKPTDGSATTSSADSETLRAGHYYTDCAYTVSTLGGF